MWHNKKKNAMPGVPAPAKPAAKNATAQMNPDKPSSATLKIGTPEIRVGLSAAKIPTMNLKPSKNPKMGMPKAIKIPKPKKVK
jgi:hypothetical protein